MTVVEEAKGGVFGADVALLGGVLALGILCRTTAGVVEYGDTDKCQEIERGVRRFLR